jgi:deazaflavin-dependent oxidoreductase (nitroreductase family)
MVDVRDWNTQIIEEFRANEGKVGGRFEGATMLLLHTTGAKSGQERVNPLVYLADGDDMVVFASKGGAPTNPDWYHNLLANPEVTVEVGTTTVRARARVTKGEERDALWARQVAARPQFADYEASTDRVIPVIVLEPQG